MISYHQALMMILNDIYLWLLDEQIYIKIMFF